MKKKPKKLTLGEILPKYTIDDVIETEADKEAVKVAEDEIDRHLDRLQEYIGRELVEIERRAVFDIVEEKSTKDEEGYIVLFFSFIQAWKIYEQQVMQLKKSEN
jgi:hypothetical protein